ncbi:MAG: ABC transporter permease [Polyangiaceae bacterium]|nr:ABC transporter permease [Polyangiaceae bacterium]
MRLAAATLLVVVLAWVSLVVGVGDVTWRAFIPGVGGAEHDLLLISRIPRTLALILAGTALSVAGLLMQMLARNRFAEPSTTGTSESASLGVLAVMVLTPELPVLGKMAVAAGFALAGTGLFLWVLRQIPLRSPLIVPLVGLMLGGVIESITTFFAYRLELLQSLNAWTMGDFSSVLRGRYELLWFGFGLTLVAYVTADRFTLAGLGKGFMTNLGLNHGRVMALGLVIVSMVTATVVVSVGMIPFLGLIVPNLVSLRVGDNARRSIPWVGIVGAGFVLACDVLGRIIRYPYEVPVGTVAGVLGSAAFLYLLLGSRARVG